MRRITKIAVLALAAGCSGCIDFAIQGWRVHLGSSEPAAMSGQDVKPALSKAAESGELLEEAKWSCPLKRPQAGSSGTPEEGCSKIPSKEEVK